MNEEDFSRPDELVAEHSSKDAKDIARANYWSDVNLASYSDVRLYTDPKTGELSEVAVADEEDFLTQTGQTRSTVFGRDAAGNEYVWHGSSGVKKEDWLENMRRLHPDFNLVEDGSKPSNYAYEAKVFQNPVTGERVTVGEQDLNEFYEQYGELWKDDLAQKHGEDFPMYAATNPSNMLRRYQLHSRQINGVTFNAYARDWDKFTWEKSKRTKNFNGEIDYNDEDLIKLGASPEQIVEGYKLVRDRIGRADTKLKDSGQIDTKEYYKVFKSLETTGEEGHGAVAAFGDFYFTASDNIVNTWLAKDSLREMSETYGAANGAKLLKENATFYDRARMYYSLAGANPLNAIMMAREFDAIAKNTGQDKDEILHQVFADYLKKFRQLDKEKSVRDVSNWGETLEGATQMVGLGAKQTVNNLVGQKLAPGLYGELVGAALGGTAEAMTSATGRLYQMADVMELDPMTGRLEKVANGRGSFDAIVASIADKTISNVVEVVGGKIVNKALRVAAKPTIGVVARKLLSEPMRRVLGLSTGLVNEGQLGRAAKLIFRARLGVNRAINSRWWHAADKYTNISNVVNPINMLEEQAEEIMDAGLKGVFNIDKSRVDYELGELEGFSLSNGFQAMMDTVRAAPALASQMAVYSLAMGVFGGSMKSISSQYTNSANVREGLRRAGYSNKDIRAMTTEQRRKAFEDYYLTGSAEAAEEVRQEYSDPAKSDVSNADLVARAVQFVGTQNASVNMDADGNVTVTITDGEGELAKYSGLDARKWAVEVLATVAQNDGRIALEQRENMTKIATAALFLRNSDVKRALSAIRSMDLDSQLGALGNDTFDALSQALAMRWMATSSNYAWTGIARFLTSQAAALEQYAFSQRDFMGLKNPKNGINFDLMKEYRGYTNSAELFREAPVSTRAKPAFTVQSFTDSMPGTATDHSGVPGEHTSTVEGVSVKLNTNEKGVKTYSVWFDNLTGGRAMVDTDGTSLTGLRTHLPGVRGAGMKSFNNLSDAISYANELVARADDWEARRKNLKDSIVRIATSNENVGGRSALILNSVFDDAVVMNEVHDDMKRLCTDENGDTDYERLAKAINVLKGVKLKDGRIALFLDNIDSLFDAVQTYRHESVHQGLGEYLRSGEVFSRSFRKALEDLLVGHYTLRGATGEEISVSAYHAMDDRAKAVVINETLAYMYESMESSPKAKSAFFDRVDRTAAVWNEFNSIYGGEYKNLSEKARRRELDAIMAGVFERSFEFLPELGVYKGHAKAEAALATHFTDSIADIIGSARSSILDGGQLVESYDMAGIADSVRAILSAAGNAISEEEAAASVVVPVGATQEAKAEHETVAKYTAFTLALDAVKTVGNQISDWLINPTETGAFVGQLLLGVGGAKGKRGGKSSVPAVVSLAVTNELAKTAKQVQVLSAQVENLKKQAEAAKNKLSETEAKYKEKTEQQKAKHQEQIAKQKAEHRETVEDLKSKMADERKAAQEEVDKLKAEVAELNKQSARVTELEKKMAELDRAKEDLVRLGELYKAAQERIDTLQNDAQDDGKDEVEVGEGESVQPTESAPKASSTKVVKVENSVTANNSSPSEETKQPIGEEKEASQSKDNPKSEQEKKKQPKPRTSKKAKLSESRAQLLQALNNFAAEAGRMTEEGQKSANDSNNATQEQKEGETLSAEAITDAANADAEDLVETLLALAGESAGRISKMASAEFELFNATNASKIQVGNLSKVQLYTALVDFAAERNAKLINGSSGSRGVGFISGRSVGLLSDTTRSHLIDLSGMAEDEFADALSAIYDSATSEGVDFLKIAQAYNRTDSFNGSSSAEEKVIDESDDEIDDQDRIDFEASVYRTKQAAKAELQTFLDQNGLAFGLMLSQYGFDADAPNRNEALTNIAANWRGDRYPSAIINNGLHLDGLSAEETADLFSKYGQILIAFKDRYNVDELISEASSQKANYGGNFQSEMRAFINKAHQYVSKMSGVSELDLMKAAYKKMFDVNLGDSIEKAALVFALRDPSVQETLGSDATKAKINKMARDLSKSMNEAWFTTTGRGQISLSDSAPKELRRSVKRLVKGLSERLSNTDVTVKIATEAKKFLDDNAKLLTIQNHSVSKGAEGSKTLIQEMVDFKTTLESINSIILGKDPSLIKGAPSLRFKLGTIAMAERIDADRGNTALIDALAQARSMYQEAFSKRQIVDVRDLFGRLLNARETQDPDRIKRVEAIVNKTAETVDDIFRKTGWWFDFFEQEWRFELADDATIEFANKVNDAAINAVRSKMDSLGKQYSSAIKDGDLFAADRFADRIKKVYVEGFKKAVKSGAIKQTYRGDEFLEREVVVGDPSLKDIEMTFVFDRGIDGEAAEYDSDPSARKIVVYVPNIAVNVSDDGTVSTQFAESLVHEEQHGIDDVQDMSEAQGVDALATKRFMDSARKQHETAATSSIKRSLKEIIKIVSQSNLRDDMAYILNHAERVATGVEGRLRMSADERKEAGIWGLTQVNNGTFGVKPYIDHAVSIDKPLSEKTLSFKLGPLYHGVGDVSGEASYKMGSADGYSETPIGVRVMGGDIWGAFSDEMNARRRLKYGERGDGEHIEYSRSFLQQFNDKIIHHQGELFRGVKRVLNKVGVKAENLQDDVNVEASQKNMYGKIRNQAERIARDYTTPILKLMKKHGLSHDKLNSYLYAFFAVERNEMIKARTAVVDPATGELVDIVDDGSGMSDAEAQTIKNALFNDPKRDAYMEAMKLVWAMNKDARNLLVWYGLISSKTRDTWEKLSPHYVPLRNLNTEEAFKLRRSAGRSTKADDPLAASIYQIDQIINLGEQNVANRTLGKFISKYDADGSVLGGKQMKYTGLNKSVLKSEPMFVPYGSEAEADLKARGVSLVETDESRAAGGSFIAVGDIPNELRVKVSKTVQMSPNVVSYYEYGKRRFIVFDPHNEQAVLVAKAAKHRTLISSKLSEFQKPIWGLTQRLTRWKADVSTTLNPKFVLRAFLADALAVPGILATEGKYGAIGSFAKNLLPSILTIRNFAQGKTIGNSEIGKYYLEARKEGMLTGVHGEGSFKDAAHRLSRDIKRLNGTSIRRAFESYKEFMETIGSYPEQGVRLAVYVAMRKRGMTPAQAAQYGREVTVDFNAKGEWTPAINTLWMFSNATIQGIARQLQSVKTGAEARGGGIQGYIRALTPAVIGNLVIGYISAMLLNGLGDDDDDDKVDESLLNRVSKYEYENSVVIPVGDKEYSTIPNRGIFAPFTTLGVNLFKFNKGDLNAGEMATSFAAQMFNALDFIGGNAPTVIQRIMPTALDPAMQIVEGVDYAGRELYDTNPYKTRSDSHSGKRSTADMYKTLAKNLNSATGGDEVSGGIVDIRPETYKLLTEFFLGGLMVTLNDAARTAEVITEDKEFRANDIPVVGGVIKTAPGVDSLFYRELRATNKKYEEYKAYQDLFVNAKKGSPERKRFYEIGMKMRKESPWIVDYKTLKNVSDEIRKLRDAEQATNDAAKKRKFRDRIEKLERFYIRKVSTKK